MNLIARLAEALDAELNLAERMEAEGFKHPAMWLRNQIKGTK